MLDHARPSLALGEELGAVIEGLVETVGAAPRIVGVRLLAGAREVVVRPSE